MSDLLFADGHSDSLRESGQTACACRPDLKQMNGCGIEVDAPLKIMCVCCVAE
jgi:hypothetical protein